MGALMMFVKQILLQNESGKLISVVLFRCFFLLSGLKHFVKRTIWDISGTMSLAHRPIAEAEEWAAFWQDCVGCRFQVDKRSKLRQPLVGQLGDMNRSCGIRCDRCFYGWQIVLRPIWPFSVWLINSHPAWPQKKKNQINNAAWPFTASDKLSVILASSNKNARPYLTVFQTVCCYLSLFVDPERLLLRYLGFLLWRKIKETVWAYKLIDSAHKYDTTWTLRFIWRFSSVWLIED